MITAFNLMLVALFATLCTLMTREMYIYIAHDTSGWTDYATLARLIIVVLLTMSWVYDLKHYCHTSAAGFLIIGAFIIALLNTSIVIIGQLLKALRKRVAMFIPFLIIAFSSMLAISIAAIVLLDGIGKAAPALYQIFIIVGSLWLIMVGASALFLIVQKR